jgi:hypothetical protein
MLHQKHRGRARKFVRTKQLNQLSSVGEVDGNVLDSQVALLEMVIGPLDEGLRAERLECGLRPEKRSRDLVENRSKKARRTPEAKYCTAANRTRSKWNRKGMWHPPCRNITPASRRVFCKSYCAVLAMYLSLRSRKSGFVVSHFGAIRFYGDIWGTP